MGVKRFAELRHIDDAKTAAAYRSSFKYYTTERLLISIVTYTTAFALFGGIFLIPFAMVLAERDRIHIIVKIVVSFLPPILQSILAIITTILSITAIVMVAWSGVLQVENAIVRPDMVTFVLRAPLAPLITVTVIGLAVLCGYLLHHLWEESIKAVKK